MRALSVLVFVAAVVGALLGVAMAQPGDEVINACVHDNSRVVRIVGGSGECRGGEQPVSWNVRGPQGPAGPQGPTGPPGPAGGLTTDAGRLAACHARQQAGEDVTVADCDREALLAR